MLKFKRILATAAATSLLVLAVASPVQAVECDPSLQVTGGCPTITTTVDPDKVVLEGLELPPGTTPDTTTHDAPSDAPPSASPFDPLADCADPLSATCVRPYIATVTAPVTLADIAAFRPTPPVDHMEPNGWTIAGLDTNFYATGGAHIKDGTLLGQPASVRFTPVEWHWSYGDGAAASHLYPGSTWAAQGVREFDPTGTSHVYDRYGTYSIDLYVEFAPEYRFAGGPWVPIVGRLTVPANRLVITVGDAKTVLVERECTRNPSGPGC